MLIRLDRKLGGGGKDSLDHYLQTRSAREGLGPYKSEAVKEAYRKHVERTGEAVEVPGGGFYYPPQFMVLIYPLSYLPWSIEPRVWQVMLVLMSVSCGLLAWTFGRGPGDHGLAAAIVVAALLLNPLTQTVMALGQVVLVLCAGAAIGQFAYERGRPWLGAIAWGLIGTKPNFGVPLFVAAGVIGGWRRLVEVGLAIVGWNLLGCLITAGTPAILLNYPGHLAGSALDVFYNRVDNDQVISWNRLVFAAGGPRIDLKIWSVLVGCAAWGGLVWWRCVASGKAPVKSPEYVLASASIAALLCAQAKGYDMMLLVLLAPLILRRWDEGRRLDVALILGLFAVASVPRGVVLWGAGRIHLGGHILALTMSYRGVVVAALAAYLLIRGNASPRLRDGT